MKDDLLPLDFDDIKDRQRKRRFPDKKPSFSMKETAGFFIGCNGGSGENRKLHLQKR